MGPHILKLGAKLGGGRGEWSASYLSCFIPGTK